MQLLWPVLLLLAVAATLSETTSKSRSLQEASNEEAAATSGGGEANTASSEAAATEGGEAAATEGASSEAAATEGEASGASSEAAATEGGEAETGGGESEGGEAEGAEAETEESGEAEEAEEAEEEEEEKPDPASVAASIVLAASISIGMVLLWLMNSRRAGIRTNSWQLFNAVITVFLAVLYYQALDAIFDASLGPEQAESSDEKGRVGLAAVQSLVWSLIILVYNLFAGKRGWTKSNSYEGINQVLSHIGSFASKTFLNALMHLHPFDDSAGTSCLAVLVLLLINLLAGPVMRFAACKVVPDYAESVCEKLRDMQTDIISVSSGFGVVQIVRFAYYKKLPSAELLEAKVDHTTEFSVLFVSLAVAVFLVGMVIMTVQRRLQLSSETANMHVDSLKMTCVLMSSWLWVFWGDLQIVTLANSSLLGLVLMATGYSLVAVVFVVSSDMCGRELPFRDLLVSCSSWVVALSWEETFDIASEVVAEDVEVSPWIIRCIISFAMASIIVPSWFQYILPRSLEVAEQTDEKENSDGKPGAEEGPNATVDHETVEKIDPTETATKDQTTIDELESKVRELQQQIKEKDTTIKILDTVDHTQL